MILFTIMVIALLVMLATILITVIGGGVVSLALFGDVIVCALILWVIIKLFRRKKK